MCTNHENAPEHEVGPKDLPDLLCKAFGFNVTEFRPYDGPLWTMFCGTTEALEAEQKKQNADLDQLQGIRDQERFLAGKVSGHLQAALAYVRQRHREQLTPDQEERLSKLIFTASRRQLSKAQLEMLILKGHEVVDELGIGAGE